VNLEFKPGEQIDRQFFKWRQVYRWVAAMVNRRTQLPFCKTKTAYQTFNRIPYPVKANFAREHRCRVWHRDQQRAVDGEILSQTSQVSNHTVSGSVGSADFRQPSGSSGDLRLLKKVAASADAARDCIGEDE